MKRSFVPMFFFYVPFSSIPFFEQDPYSNEYVLSKSHRRYSQEQVLRSLKFPTQVIEFHMVGNMRSKPGQWWHLVVTRCRSASCSRSALFFFTRRPSYEPNHQTHLLVSRKLGCCWKFRRKAPRIPAWTYNITYIYIQIALTTYFDTCCHSNGLNHRDIREWLHVRPMAYSS